MTGLIKAVEVARQLGVTEARVYELARLGILPSVRLGRQIRFRPELIERFVEAGGQPLPGGWRREVSQ